MALERAMKGGMGSFSVLCFQSWLFHLKLPILALILLIIGFVKEANNVLERLRKRVDFIIFPVKQDSRDETEMALCFYVT